MATKKNENDGAFHIAPIVTQTMTFHVLGLTPFLFNRQSEKAKHHLLLPPRKKNTAELEQTLKHNPLEEYRASPYIEGRTRDFPTYFHMTDGMFKGALSKAAIDIPGATKSAVGRLVSNVRETIPIWGAPTLRVDMVRQAGINRTPDVRIRCCLPEWCAVVTFSFLPQIITPASLANLFQASGRICGVGDFRVEKGGSCGQYEIVEQDDPDFVRIQQAGGRAQQEHGWKYPEFYNDEARELCEWFDEEIDARRRAPTAEKRTARASKAKATNGTGESPAAN